MITVFFFPINILHLLNERYFIQLSRNVQTLISYQQLRNPKRFQVPLYVFINLINSQNMKIQSTLIFLLLLSSIGIAQQICRQNDSYLLNYLKKGMTYQVQQWPVESNNWVGRIGCNGCNPVSGDEPCTSILPVLCIIHHKVIDRPYYDYTPLVGPYDNPDRGYYNGWTGGVFTVTPPVRGYDVDSYKAGDQLCKDYWGKNAKFAEFKDGFFMELMNHMPSKTWRFWNWKKATCGGWSFWGYFNTNYNGRAWTWIDNQPRSNCGAI